MKRKCIFCERCREEAEQSNTVVTINVKVVTAHLEN